MFSIEKKMGVGEGGGGLGARNSSFITFRPLYTKQVKIRGSNIFGTWRKAWNTCTWQMD